MIFLVPRSWIYRQEVQERIDAGSQGFERDGIVVQIRNWEELLDIFGSSLEDRSSVLEEFRKLLLTQFRPIKFSEEEIRMLFSTESRPVLEAVLKFESVVEAIHTKAKTTEFCGGTRRHWPDEIQDEYGVYFWRISPQIKKEKYGLWFGISLHLFRSHDTPIWLMVKNSLLREVPGLAEAFSAACDGPTIKCRGEWTAGRFNSSILETSNSVEEIWSKLEPVLLVLSGSVLGGSKFGIAKSPRFESRRPRHRQKISG
jgi:hypothetical protein